MAYQTRPVCDSYFVEAHDEHARSLRAERREHENMLKRQRQLTMAEDLSDQVSQEYGADVLQHMERMEVDGLWLQSVEKSG